MSEKIYTVIYFHQENDYNYSPVVIASCSSKIEAQILMLKKYQEKVNELCEKSSKDNFEFFFAEDNATISDDYDNSYEFEIYDNFLTSNQNPALRKEYHDIRNELLKLIN